MNLNVDHLITLADMDEDALFQLYLEAKAKLKNNSITEKERKMYTLRVIYIRSIISDRYSLKLRHSTPNFDDPMNNEKVNRFFK